MSRVLPAIVLLLPLASCAATPDSVLRDEISATWDRHMEAAVHKDLDAVLEIYADDIVYAAPGQPEVHGIDAVRAMERNTIEMVDLISAEHTTHDLRVWGDVAYETGTVVGPIRPHGQEAAVETWHFMAMWRRGADGVWEVRYLVGLPE